MVREPVLSVGWSMSDLEAAREQFITSRAAPAGVRQVVVESWQRSLVYGLEPRELPPQVVDPGELAAARARSRALMEAAEPLLRQAHQALAHAPHIVALSDGAGRILRLLRGPGLSEANLQETNLLEGCSWHERDIGSNGIGTALAMEQPVILMGAEHFQQAYVGWTCIGVPIRDAGGEVVGALDLSVPNAQVHIHTWGWALTMGQQIESALRSAAPPSVVPDLAHPFHAVRGVFDLLLRQLGLGPTHAATLEAAREQLTRAERQLDGAVAAVKRSELLARQELAEIQAIYDTAPGGLAVLDRDLRFVRVNARMAELHGLPAAELLGAGLAEVAPDIAAVVEPRLREVLATGEPMRGVPISLQLAGETRHLVAHYAPLRESDGSPFGINVVVEDVTEKKRAGEELKRLYEEATQAARERELVVAMVGHDLRNPLFSLDLARRALASGQVGEEELAASLSRMGRSVQQMRRLIRDLADVSAMGRGVFRVELAPEAPLALLRSCVALHAPLADERGVRLQVRSPDGDLPLVSADEARILQVLSNLIGNALRFTPPGGRIELAAEAAADGVRISVADDGPGMSPEVAAKAFQPYWQGQRASGTQGLGLAISEGIVTAHGGRIWIVSEPRAGAEVCFTLPLAPGGVTRPATSG